MLHNLDQYYSPGETITLPRFDPGPYNFMNLSINSPRDWELLLKAKAYEKEVRKVIQHEDLSRQHALQKEISREIVATMEDTTLVLSDSLGSLTSEIKDLTSNKRKTSQASPTQGALNYGLKVYYNALRPTLCYHRL